MTVRWEAEQRPQMKYRKPAQPRPTAPGGQSGFRLPPDISFRKQALPNGWADVFRHRLLGDVGRIVLQDTGDGRPHISYEVVGDPADPQTAERAALFQPFGRELAWQMKGLPGPTMALLPVPLPPRPPEPKEVIESRLIPCERCGTMVALLILAPLATDAASFEDYARKMYPKYTRRNLPTWIIGPALGSGPLMDRPADILPIWPTRAPIARLRPAEFNPMLDQLVAGHCG